MTTSQTESAPFPLRWRSPEEATLTWVRDPMHFPAAVCALTASFLEGPFERGITAACEELQLPMASLYHRAFNSHVYNCAAPAGPPEAMEARLARNHEVMTDRMDRLRAIWDDEYRPRLEAIAAEIDGLPMERAADLERLLDLAEESVRIHFLLVFPRLGSGERFAGIYAAATGSEVVMEPYRCLLGEPNKSLEADRALWGLARRATAVPAVAQALGREGAAAVLAALDASEEGRAWRAELDAVLAEYGRRTQAIGFDSPTWIEDPSFPLENVRRYLRDDALDPEGARAAHLAERERLVAAAHAAMEGAPPELRQAFDGALAAARGAWPLEEDHAFYIDQRIWGAAMRGAFLRLGARLAADGRLESPEDAVHLTIDELRAAAGGEDVREPARAGRRRQADDALLDSPPLIGAPPDPSIPMDPGLVKFFGAPGPPEFESGVLRGSAGSSGRAEGVARVVASVGELSSVEPGEILVCRSTTPPWTPVFGSIAALVTDTGGVLAHGAIVAREYGIPAVMGTKAATRVIRTGQRLVVDGDAGEVRLVG